MISQFHEFFTLKFGGFLPVGPTVRCGAAAAGSVITRAYLQHGGMLLI